MRQEIERRLRALEDRLERVHVRLDGLDARTGTLGVAAGGVTPGGREPRREGSGNARTCGAR